MPRERVDVVIVGAGVAGLAAARRLHRAGLTVRIVEAQARIGGRVRTLRDPRVAAPIELGAEFLHGEAAAVVAIAREGGLPSYEVTGPHYQATGGTPAPLDDFWAQIGRVFAAMSNDHGPDESLSASLARKPGGASLARARELALEFVEGFHAAEADRVSARAVAAENPMEDPVAQRMGRLASGFDRVPDALARELHGALWLRSVVRAVRWRRGRATVDIEREGLGPARVDARAAILTVSLGVLAAPEGAVGAIRVEPRPGLLDRHASRLAMGHVVRVVLLLEDAFWEHVAPDADAAVRAGCFSFLHTHDADIPMWWTQFPLRAPLLVGWAGGSRARRLSALEAGSLRAAAVESLARQLGVPGRRLTSLVRHAWMHDWSADPFVRGAYSYPLVGGGDAAGAMGKPVQQTLFFAGEATAAGGDNATVHGALDSGERAAGQVMRALG